MAETAGAAGAAGSAGMGGSGGVAGTGGVAGAGGGSAGADAGPVVHPPTFAGVAVCRSGFGHEPAGCVAGGQGRRDRHRRTSSIASTWRPLKGDENFGAPQLETPPGATSAVVGNLQPGNDYFVVVRAMNEAGDEDDERTKEIKGTPAVDTTPPTFAGITAAKTTWTRAR